jgi:hypothetical protein
MATFGLSGAWGPKGGCCWGWWVLHAFLGFARADGWLKLHVTLAGSRMALHLDLDPFWTRRYYGQARYVPDSAAQMQAGPRDKYRDNM